jgi:hypothetical protein
MSLTVDAGPDMELSGFEETVKNRIADALFSQIPGTIKQTASIF